MNDLTKVRVVVLEDDPSCRLLMKDLLEIHGAIVLAVDNADEAEWAVEDFLPDVLVCDLEVPGRDGYELIRSLRGRGCTVPAMAVTAWDDLRSFKRSRDCGFQLYFGKPFAVDQFAAGVASLVGVRGSGEFRVAR